MPWTKIEKFTCSRCGKSFTEGYVNKDGKQIGSHCKACSVAVRVERRATGAAAKAAPKKAAPTRKRQTAQKPADTKRTRARKGAAA